MLDEGARCRVRIRCPRGASGLASAPRRAKVKAEEKAEAKGKVGSGLDGAKTLIT